MNVKYRLEGEDTLGRDIRIDIGDDVYAGVMTKLPLVSANLSREQGDGGIQATSLSIVAMSMQDGDCDALYVRDSTRWFVELYVDNAIQWRGYILRELKDTYYRNSPCEVRIKAVDGIGVLKEINYRPSYNRVSLWGILTWIATRTRLNCEFCAMDNLEVGDLTKTGNDRSWLATTYINDAVFDGMTAYDMLAVLTENLSAYFTQVEGNFLFYRTDRLGKSSLGAINIRTTDNTWYYKTSAGKIGSMTADVDFSPVGTFQETVEPAKKHLPVVIKRDSVSALGEPNMVVSLPTWTATNTPVNFVHTAGTNRQLYIAHGYYQRQLSMSAPGYPSKFKISGASLGGGKLYVRVYTSQYIHDFERKKVGESANRWYTIPSGTTMPDLGVEHKFAGAISLLPGHPTTNIPYNYYRVDKMEDLELEIDAFPADVIGTKVLLTVSIIVDKSDTYASSDAWQKLNGVWLGNVELNAEAFEDEQYYVQLNDDAIDEAEEFSMLLQESPDDNGSQYYIPGVITYKNGDPIHEVTTFRGSDFVTMPFDELIARERASRYKSDRVVLKGEIIGSDAFNRLFFYNVDNGGYIYQPTKLDCDVINRMTSVELLSVMHSAQQTTLSYPIATADEIVDDYESIAEIEYRLKVEFTEATAKGGNLGKNVSLERYEFGVLVSRTALAANATTGYTMEIMDAVDWARTRSNGVGVTIDKQPLAVGNERAVRIKVKYTIDGVELSKIATARQQANSYEVTSKVLNSGTGLTAINSDSMSTDGKTIIIWKGGGGVSLNYGSYEYAETRVWATGDTEEALVYEPVKFELVDPWSGLELVEYNGIVQGVQSSETSEQRECTLKLSNLYTGGDVEEYLVHQFNLTKAVSGIQLQFANSSSRLAPATAVNAVLDNIDNKGILWVRFSPENTSEATTIDLQALNTVMIAETKDGGRSYILTLRPNAGNGSQALKVTSASGLSVQLTLSYKYNS